MNQGSYKFKLFAKTTPKPLHQLMCPFPVYKKLGAKNVDTKCQTEEVCRLFYVFQKERHGFDRWTSISLSIHPSLYLFIIDRTLGADKSEETIEQTNSDGNPQQLTMELASLASHSLTWFENGHYLVLAWCETIDPDLRRVRREQLRLIAAMNFMMERLCITALRLYR